MDVIGRLEDIVAKFHVFTLAGKIKFLSSNKKYKHTCIVCYNNNPLAKDSPKVLPITGHERPEGE